MLEENKCAVCEAEFGAGHLKEGICLDCNKLYPGVKTKEGLKKEKAPKVESRETHIKELVTKQVNELLESFGILHRCLNCGNLYFRRSPAQKNCSACKKEAINNG